MPPPSFGMIMPGRSFSATSEYRYGFNGKENDKDISAGAQDYGMRIYDSRLGKFLSVDPLTKEYPMLTPYQYASNNPIQNIDIDGLEGGSGNGARTNTDGILDPLKGTKQTYDNANWFGWPGSTKQSIFVQNSVTSAWNQGLSVIESSPSNISYIFSKHSRQEKFEMLTNLTTTAIKWWNSKPFQQVSTYEDIAGGILLGEAMGIANPFARGNSYLKLIARDKVSVRIANAEEARYLEAMGKKADYNPYGNSKNPKGDILLSKDSRIQLVEEAIHYKQTKENGIKYVENNLNQLEFDAQNELLRIGRSEGWSKSAMAEINRAKIIWGKKLIAELESKLKAQQKSK